MGKFKRGHKYTQLDSKYNEKYSFMPPHAPQENMVAIQLLCGELIRAEKLVKDIAEDLKKLGHWLPQYVEVPKMKKCKTCELIKCETFFTYKEREDYNFSYTYEYEAAKKDNPNSDYFNRRLRKYKKKQDNCDSCNGIIDKNYQKWLALGNHDDQSLSVVNLCRKVNMTPKRLLSNPDLLNVIRLEIQIQRTINNKKSKTNDKKVQSA